MTTYLPTAQQLPAAAGSGTNRSCACVGKEGRSRNETVGSLDGWLLPAKGKRVSESAGVALSAAVVKIYIGTGTQKRARGATTACANDEALMNPVPVTLLLSSAMCNTANDFNNNDTMVPVPALWCSPWSTTGTGTGPGGSLLASCRVAGTNSLTDSHLTIPAPSGQATIAATVTVSSAGSAGAKHAPAASPPRCVPGPPCPRSAAHAGQPGGVCGLLVSPWHSRRYGVLIGRAAG